jgi:putative ABC transport system permease protein
MLAVHYKRNKSLWLVSLLELSVIFACLALSYAYLKKETGYDRFHPDYRYMARFSIRYDNRPVDGRILNFRKNSPLIAGIPEIKDAVVLSKVQTGVLTYREKSQVVNEFYFATSNFFDVFGGFELLLGDKATALNAPEKAVISESFAGRLFGKESPVGKEIRLTGRQFTERTAYVSGVFKDFPETSHFHANLILNRPDDDDDAAGSWPYVYLLLNEQTGVGRVQQILSSRLEELGKDNPVKASAYLLPLADIHLHSRVQRELEPNGSISLVYLTAGANLLFLTLVLFNLWINAGLILAASRKYYRILRIHGAPPSVVWTDEVKLYFLLGCASVLLGGLAAYVLLAYFQLGAGLLGVAEVFVLCTLFVALVVFISLLPVLGNLSSDVKFILIAQYGLTMFIVMLGTGIGKQIRLIKTVQTGGREKTILVMREQPDAVKAQYELFKTELTKYPEIESVTSAMQLPGTSVRDMLPVRKEGDTESEAQNIPILVVGDDFLPFFGVEPLAGSVFRKNPRTLREEEKLFYDTYAGNRENSNQTEEYVINRKAAQALGFPTAEEAVGKWLLLGDNGGAAYINKGQIVGVTDDFTYTTAYEEPIPLILLQRKLFQHCILVRFAPGGNNYKRGLATFYRVWEDVFPSYPPDYAFLQDVYAEVYHNEFNAERLAYAFSLLSLVITNLGLIIVMAFVIKRKTKEIGIRKINGATAFDIIRLLNNRLVAWTGIAFAFAAPAAYWAMSRWLGNFAVKASLDWRLFAAAGAFVLVLSLVSVSWQSWHAANQNPVKSLKME